MRFDIEENFLDDKAGGFELERSMIRCAPALSRLCLVLAIATVYLTLQGTAVVAQGKRRWVDPHWQRGNSYLRIGWNWVKTALARGWRLFETFCLTSNFDPAPAIASRKQHQQRLYTLEFQVRSFDYACGVLSVNQRQRIETIHGSPLQNQHVLVIGNPTMPTIPLTEPPETLHPLPGAEAEANAIASLLNTQPIIGDKGTKVYIEKLLPTARLIHLATHGLLDDIKQLGIPGAIALAPSGEDNGFLTAGEIYEMKLNAELVVLSACHSGQGKITGDGVVGLSRCLFAAGVPSVIVSLWSVGDDSTQFLMSEFYQNLQNGINKAQALRQAMLTTIADYSEEPQCWAAFTLLGEAE